MRTTITVDDELYRQALELADPGMDKADILREAVRVFVRVQSARRLAELGGKVSKDGEHPTATAGIEAGFCGLRASRLVNVGRAFS
jgi:hypothetical protein